MKNTFPQSADLQQLWASTGLIDPTASPFDTIDWGTAISSSVAEFQRLTGRTLIPIWQTRYFDPPSGPSAKLFFKADLASTLGISPAGQAMYSNGLAPSGNPLYLNGRIGIVMLQGGPIVANSDFFWGPSNTESEGAEGEGRPWTWLEFQSFFPSPMQAYLRKSIAITAYWGYIAPNAAGAPQILDDIWHAILHMAAIETIPEIEASISGGRTALTTPSVKHAFNGLEPQFKRWTSGSSRTIETHKKREFF